MVVGSVRELGHAWSRIDLSSSSNRIVEGAWPGAPDTPRDPGSRPCRVARSSCRQMQLNLARCAYLVKFERGESRRRFIGDMARCTTHSNEPFMNDSKCGSLTGFSWRPCMNRSRGVALSGVLGSTVMMRKVNNSLDGKCAVDNLLAMDDVLKRFEEACKRCAEAAERALKNAFPHVKKQKAELRRAIRAKVKKLMGDSA